jgi:hypothetical protein
MLARPFGSRPPPEALRVARLICPYFTAAAGACQPTTGSAFDGSRLLLGRAHTFPRRRGPATCVALAPTAILAPTTCPHGLGGSLARLFSSSFRSVGR